MKHLKTIFACLLMAVLSIGQVWADKITAVANIESGKTYYIGATKSNSTDYYLSIADHGVAAASGKAGSAVTSKSDADVFTFTQSGDNWTIQFASGKYLSLKNAKANGKVDVVDDAASWTISDENSLLLLAINNYCLKCNSQTSTTNFGSYASGQLNVWLEEASATPAVLLSIAVSGTPTTTSYENGNAFDPAGLVVTGTYDVGDPAAITSGITWTACKTESGTYVALDDEAVALAKDETGIYVKATVGEITSPAFHVTGLTVTAATPKITIDGSAEGITSTDENQNITAGVGSFAGKFKSYSGGVMFTSGTGYIYNTASFGYIRKITINYRSGGSASAVQWISMGDAALDSYAQDITNGVKYESSTGGSSNTFVVDGDYEFFRISVSSKNLQAASIVIEYDNNASAPKAATPTFPTGDENFVTSTSVTLACTTEGAKIYYTTNGDVPTSSSTLYNGAIPVSATTTIKAIAVADGMDNSNVAEKTFTKATILTVAEALTIIEGLDNKTATTAEYYVSGVVSTVTALTVDGTGEYYISADGTKTSELQVYKGKWVGGANFTSTDQLIEGDDVTIKGKLKKYNSYKELDQNNEVVLYKLKARLAWSEESYEADLSSSNTFPSLTNTNGVSVSYSSTNTDAATINPSTGAISLVAVGSTTIKATFTGNETYKANEVSYTLNVSNSVLRADISFEENGGSTVTDLTEQSNLPDPLPTITKAGYNFGGWWTTSDFQDGTEAVAGAAVESTDAITLYAKWLEPYNIAAAKAVIDANTSGIANQYVAGKISQIDSYSSTYHSITYWISDDGTTTDQIQVYSGLIGNAATPLGKEAFDAKENLELGDEVVVFGTLKLHNSDVYEFDKNNTIYSFNRPAVPIISANPVAVDAAAHAGQSVTITYENWGTVNVADADATLFDDADCTIAFSGGWISNISFEDPYTSVSFDIAANTGEARIAYMKIYALGDDVDTEAEKVIAISQEAYVAPAEPASLPFAFDGGKADIATTQGMSQDGLDNSDYTSSPKLKFKAEGAWAIIEIASAPGKLTYDIKGNSFNGGTFKVQESADGSGYSDVATYTELSGTTQNEEKTLDQDTRFVKFIYTTKDAGNVALGNIAIAEYVAPAAVETPAFSPAGGEYAGAQSVELSCTTEGAAIYYTTNGDDPDNTKTLYEGAINVDATMTIKAIAYKGDDHSEIASATYTITAPLTDYYEKVTSGDVAEGTYLIVYEAGNVAFNGGLETLDAVSNTIDVEITNDHKIGVTPATAAATFYIDPTAGTIKSASGRYIGRTANTNGLNASETEAYTNTISIDGDGNAVIVGSGSTATYLRYNPNQGQTRFRYFTQNQQMIALYKLANDVIKPASGLAWDPADDIEITVGDAFTAPTLLNPNTIPAEDITIESSNTDLATVTAGVVELVENATGTTTITATYTGETYKPTTVSYKIKVNPAASIYVSPSLNVNFGSVEKDAALPADKTITVTLNNVATATATLGGTNPEAFSIDPATLTENGDITISVVSTATVANYAATLTISDDAGNAESKVVNLSFSVTEPAGEETPVSTTSKWVAATEIVDGMQVLITGVKSDDVYAMGEQKNNNRAAVAASVDGEGVLTPGENTMAFTLVAQGDGTYALRTSNGKYLYAAASGSNYLKTQDEVDVNAKWTMTVASASAEGSSNRHVMQFNTGSTLFSCYASAGGSGMAAIKLYVPQTTPATPDYTRDVTNGHYGTICLPKAGTIEGATLYEIGSFESNMIYVDEVGTTLAAGVPYIFYASEAQLNVYYTDKTADDVPAGNVNGLYGFYNLSDEAATFDIPEDAGNYILYNDQYWEVSGRAAYIANYRAYIKLGSIVPKSAAPGRRRVAMAVNGTQTTTGIEDLNASEKPMKMMINGQIFILRGEKMYDTTGRLVK